MTKYFLVSNLSECYLFSKEYVGTHIPFVLNIHEFEYFDKRNIPFVTIGHFINSKQTRAFFRNCLYFIRRFVGDMDLANLEVAKKIFGIEIGLFSSVAYSIFIGFCHIFRFAFCVDLMRRNDVCEFVIPLSKTDRRPMEMVWVPSEGAFRNRDEVFKTVFEYFIDTNNLRIKRVYYVPEVRNSSKRKKQDIYSIIRPVRNAFRHFRDRLTYHACKQEKYVLNMGERNLWSSVMKWSRGSDLEGDIGVVPISVAIRDEYGSRENSNAHENSKVEVSRIQYRHDKFLTFFRCTAFIEKLLIGRYEQILSESKCLFMDLQELFSKEKLCGVVGIASGTNVVYSLISQLAKQAGIPVIGMQHGGHYGYMDFFEKLGITDYYVCDYWFSWGFNGEYLRKTFPFGEQIPPEIIPVGSTAISQFKKRKTLSSRKRIKLIYPITIVPRLSKSTFRTDDYKLYKFQKKILNKLFLSKIEVLVKPCEGYPIAQENMLNDRPQNVSVSFATLRKVYEKFNFDWVVIDLLSTPFEEACVFDCQILAFNDSTIWPIESRARELMEKRAWIFDDELGFLNMLDKILAGQITEKRLNSSFEKDFILPFGENTMQKARSEFLRIVLNNQRQA